MDLVSLLFRKVEIKPPCTAHIQDRDGLRLETMSPKVIKDMQGGLPPLLRSPLKLDTVFLNARQIAIVRAVVLREIVLRGKRPKKG